MLGIGGVIGPDHLGGNYEAYITNLILYIDVCERISSCNWQGQFGQKLSNFDCLIVAVLISKEDWVLVNFQCWRRVLRKVERLQFDDLYYQDGRTKKKGYFGNLDIVILMMIEDRLGWNLLCWYQVHKKDGFLIAIAFLFGVGRITRQGYYGLKGLFGCLWSCFMLIKGFFGEINSCDWFKGSWYFYIWDLWRQGQYGHYCEKIYIVKLVIFNFWSLNDFMKRWNQGGLKVISFIGG